VAQSEGFSEKVGFIWSVADLLRGDYKAHEYGQVILPLTVLRRLDCVLEATKAAVMAKTAALEGRIGNRDPIRPDRIPWFQDLATLVRGS
jgi:type I restriction enzyme M protein